jgi:hypothetical protein
MHITTGTNTTHEQGAMTELKFIGRVSSMGKRNIVYIPDEYHKIATKLRGKQVRVRIDDEISYD